MNNRLPKDHLLLLDAIASQRARDADKKQKGSSYFKIEIYFFPFLRRFELRWKSRHAYLDWIVGEVGGNGSCWLLRSRCRSKPAAAEAAHHTHNGLGRLNIYRSTGLTGSLDSRVRWTSPPAASWFIFFFLFPCVTLERGEERNNRANRVMDRPVLLLLLLLGTHQKAYHASCGTPSPLSQNDAPQNPSNKLFRSSLSAMESTKRKKKKKRQAPTGGRNASQRTDGYPSVRVRVWYDGGRGLGGGCGCYWCSSWTESGAWTHFSSRPSLGSYHCCLLVWLYNDARCPDCGELDTPHSLHSLEPNCNRNQLLAAQQSQQRPTKNSSNNFCLDGTM